MTPDERRRFINRTNHERYRRRRGITAVPNRAGIRVVVDHDALSHLIAGSGSSLYAVESAAELSRGALSNILRRRGCCTEGTAERVADVLCVHPSAFVRGPQL